MISLFSIIAITSIWVLGIKIATAEGMVLESVGNWAINKAVSGKRIFEPLLVCHWCMPSIHSLFGYGFFFALTGSMSWGLVACYPIAVMGSSLLCGLIWGVKSIMEQKIQLNEEIIIEWNSEVHKEYFENVRRN